MAQHDYEIANQGFPQFRADLNDALSSIATNNSGATAPSTTNPYQFWYDTANDILKIRNADDDAWISFASFDQTNDNWTALVKGITLDGVAITATGTELNYVDGVTSAIQTQLDNLDTNKVEQTGSTGSAELPSGTTAQRDASPSAGYIRFNSTTSGFEGYDGSAWGSIGGGASGGGSDAAFYENDQTITADYTITSNRNAMSTGPVTVDDGVTVTIPTGSRYVVI